MHLHSLLTIPLLCLCLALVAEVVKYYHPNVVDLHNYPAAQALHKKTTNWNILNRLQSVCARN